MNKFSFTIFLAFSFVFPNIKDIAFGQDDNFCGGKLYSNTFPIRKTFENATYINDIDVRIHYDSFPEGSGFRPQISFVAEESSSTGSAFDGNARAFAPSESCNFKLRYNDDYQVIDKNDGEVKIQFSIFTSIRTCYTYWCGIRRKKLKFYSKKCSGWTKLLEGDHKLGFRLSPVQDITSDAIVLGFRVFFSHNDREIAEIKSSKFLFDLQDAIGKISEYRNTDAQSMSTVLDVFEIQNNFHFFRSPFNQHKVASGFSMRSKHLFPEQVSCEIFRAIRRNIQDGFR